MSVSKTNLLRAVTEERYRPRSDISIQSIRSHSHKLGENTFGFNL